MRLPARTHGIDAPPVRRTLAGTLLLAGLLLAVMVAISAPAVLAGLFLTAAVSVAVLRAVRQHRLRLGRGSRRVCVPHTTVCIDA